MNTTMRLFIAGLVGSVTAVVLDNFNLIDYHLSMKFIRYEHFF